MTSPTQTDLRDLVETVSARYSGTRLIVALAGAPGSGKSTVAQSLRDLLAARGHSAAVLQMDGFHYDDAVLEARGLRAVKGAPQTFDVDGFASLLARVRDNSADEVATPVFDRSLEISRAGAAIIP
ncbi:MAG: adenylyl-sulfate kinase, partial [Pseudomonadota bacterium]